MVEAQQKWRADRLAKIVGNKGGPIVCECICGATVVPHPRERAPILCSNCRQERVYQIIGDRLYRAYRIAVDV